LGFLNYIQFKILQKNWKNKQLYWCPQPLHILLKVI